MAPDYFSAALPVLYHHQAPIRPRISFSLKLLGLLGLLLLLGLIAFGVDIWNYDSPGTIPRNHIADVRICARRELRQGVCSRSDATVPLSLDDVVTITPHAGRYLDTTHLVVRVWDATYDTVSRWDQVSDLTQDYTLPVAPRWNLGDILQASGAEGWTMPGETLKLQIITNGAEIEAPTFTMGS